MGHQQIINPSQSRNWAITIAGAGRALRVPEQGYATSFDDLVSKHLAQARNLGTMMSYQQAYIKTLRIWCNANPGDCTEGKPKGIPFGASDPNTRFTPNYTSSPCAMPGCV